MLDLLTINIASLVDIKAFKPNSCSAWIMALIAHCWHCESTEQCVSVLTVGRARYASLLTTMEPYMQASSLGLQAPS